MRGASPRGSPRIPSVEYAVPDRRRHALRVANDNFINGQGYLGNGTASIGAYSAWDVTTGSPSTVVAVLDTGIPPRTTDLAGRFLPGYDMIADARLVAERRRRPRRRRMGPGRLGRHAARPPGRSTAARSANSSWHGTAVSGHHRVEHQQPRRWTAGIDWVARDPSGPRARQVRRLRLRHRRRHGVGRRTPSARRPRQPAPRPGAQPEPRRRRPLRPPSYQQRDRRGLRARRHARDRRRSGQLSPHDVAGHAPASCPGRLSRWRRPRRGAASRSYSNFGAGVDDLGAGQGQYRAGAIGNQEGIIALANAGAHRARRPIRLLQRRAAPASPRRSWRAPSSLMLSRRARTSPPRRSATSLLVDREAVSR